MHQYHLEGLLKFPHRVSGLVGLGRGAENLHFNKFPGDADAAGPEATLWEPTYLKNSSSRKLDFGCSLFHSLNKCLLCKYVPILALELRIGILHRGIKMVSLWWEGGIMFFERWAGPPNPDTNWEQGIRQGCLEDVIPLMSLERWSGYVENSRMEIGRERTSHMQRYRNICNL